MTTIKEDFIDKFGEEKWKELRCVMHSTYTPPDDETSKVIFRLLKIIDWNCCSFGDSHGLTEDDVRYFLITHKNEIKGMTMQPPSYLGMMCGRFDFVLDNNEE